MIRQVDPFVDRSDPLGRVASGIAHELATPVQFVDHNLRFARQILEELAGRMASGSGLEQELLREASEALDQAAQGTAAAVRVIGAMRNLAHPGRLSPVSADLNEELESALLMTRHRLLRVATLTDERTPLPRVECHPGLLNQVFLNLILNASDAIEEAHRKGEIPLPGRIRVATRAVDGSVEVAVSDNGAGIPEHLRARIFQPAFTTRAKEGGTGQGLSLAREIVEEIHGGSLRWIPNPGRGVTFLARVPTERSRGRRP